MIDINSLCQNCFSKTDTSADFCPHCGKKPDQIPDRSSRSLPQYTILAGRYLIGRVLGEGGFGITYLVMDLLQDTRVAIKEYFPVDLGNRETGTNHPNDVQVAAGEPALHFRNGMRRFESEALTLRKFDLLPGIVSVQDFFQENNTAYLVMEYIEGGNLKNYMKSCSEKTGHPIYWNEAFSLMRPVLDSLQKIHAAGIIHRDISPENILMDKNVKLVLIDFGSSKTSLASRENRSMTVMVKHGYAPVEQYRTHGDQGPWTDIYAVCATLYHMISGILPEDAIERLIDDKLVPLKNLKLSSPIPVTYSDIIEKGMQTRAADRYQSMEELISDLNTAKREIEEARRRAEEEQRRATEEARRKAEEEQRRIAEEERQKAEEERRRIAEEEQRKAALEAQRIAAEEKRKAALEARRKAEEERKRRAEEAHRKAEAEGQHRDEEKELPRPVSGKRRLLPLIIICMAAIAAVLLFPRFLKKKPSQMTIVVNTTSGSTVDESALEVLDQALYDEAVECGLTPAEISEMTRHDLLVQLYDNYEQEERWMEAAMILGKIGIEENDQDALDFSLQLWKESGFCKDITYREFTGVAAINADGTVKVARRIYNDNQEAGTEQVKNWKNIVSVMIGEGNSQLYGIRCDGTLVCTKFNTGSFGELTKVVMLATAINGPCAAALRADGTVYLDASENGDLVRIDDPEWHDIRYIEGGWNSLIGLRSDGVILISHLSDDKGGYHIHITETVEIRDFQDKSIIKIKADGNVILLLDSDGKAHAIRDPIEENAGPSGDWWMTDEDILELESLTDIIEIEDSRCAYVFLHRDGSIDVIDTEHSAGKDAFSEIATWKYVSDIDIDFYGGFAILSDGTMKYINVSPQQDKVESSYPAADWTGLRSRYLQSQNRGSSAASQGGNTAKASPSLNSGGTFRLRHGFSLNHFPTLRTNDSGEAVSGFEIELTKAICDYYGWEYEAVPFTFVDGNVELTENLPEMCDCICPGFIETQVFNIYSKPYLASPGGTQYAYVFPAYSRELCEKVNAALDALAENGTHREIANNYPELSDYQYPGK